MIKKFGIFLGAGFFALATIATATGNFAQRLELVTQQTQRSAKLDIGRIVLTQAPAASFGRFQARSNVIQAGTPFNIYVEPTNLSSRTENGILRASMSIDLLIRDAQGKTVAARDSAWRLPLQRDANRTPALREVYANLMLNQLNFAEGRYQIVLRVHDDLANTFADRVIDIELTGQPAQRLSLSQVNAAQR